MGRTPIRAKLVLDAEARTKLEGIAKSRTEGQARIERAKVLLAYSDGHPDKHVDMTLTALKTWRATHPQ